MTRDEILATPPGTTLDIAVAEIVMGHPVAKDDVFGYMERSILTRVENPGSG